MSNYLPVIGMEVHAQLKTKTKLFCGCSTQFGQTPNQHTCPVCLGLPGALPVLNQKAVELAIRAGLALNCTIQSTSIFSRKNYFYPDLPKGYQISQYDKPVCLNGHLDITVNGQVKRIGITRIHLEEDAGKLLHQGAEAIAGATHSLVDLNRACVPLIEIVSEPDIRTAEEARIYMQTLKQLLEHLDICDGNLDEGSLRADANVSLRLTESSPFGTRTETKNLNSFRSVERAILSEIHRQTELLDKGQPIIQQTRHYDDATQKTRALRSKEEAHDYRYFPEPDLLPLVITSETIETSRLNLPELPQAKHHRFITEWQLSPDDATTLLDDRDMLAYTEALIATAPFPPKEICKWIIGEINAVIKTQKTSFKTSPITGAHLIELLTLIQEGTLSGKMAKTILEKVAETQQSPKTLVQSSGVAQLSDTTQLTAIVSALLDANPDVVEKVKAGKTNSADFLMGQVMKQTRGQAKPDLVKSIILELIQNR